MAQDQKKPVDLDQKRRDVEADAALELMFGYYNSDQAPLSFAPAAPRKAA